MYKLQPYKHYTHTLVHFRQAKGACISEKRKVGGSMSAPDSSRGSPSIALLGQWYVVPLPLPLHLVLHSPVDGQHIVMQRSYQQILLTLRLDVESLGVSEIERCIVHTECNPLDTCKA